ncbi:MAG TPA: SUMF1/EgtB/PvdO family nonheme iron enzyme [Pyrinomonadaceae bacterium]
MSDRDNDPNKGNQNFDLTTPNIRLPNQPPRPGAPPASDFDRTSVNQPFRPQGMPPSPPSSGGSSAHNAYDLTGVHMPVPVEDDEEDGVYARRSAPAAAPQPNPMEQTAFYPPVMQQRQASPPAVPQHQIVLPQAEPQAARKRRIPLWVWLVSGGMLAFLLVALAVGAFLFLRWNSTFTLKVSNAPPGSKVYVDDVPAGVSQADGTILAQGLRAGEQREIRITHEGYSEWTTSVTGERGETIEVSARMTPLQVKSALPAEIDYNGKMLLIPAGAFTMGDDAHSPDESPAHQVTLPDYYIDKYEVTNEQYRKFCEATGHAPPVNPFWDTQYFQSNPQQPVIGISYADAEAYALWANKRLPTEAEWEKAASWDEKAKRKRLYPWGDEPDAERANVNSEHPKNVGYYVSGASAYGVQDMAGNAFEWVDAIYQPYPGSTTPNPKYTQNLRVVRGGDFRRGLDAARTTFRSLAVPPTFQTNPGDEASMKSSLVGFRTAVSADDPKLKAFLQQLK